MKKIIISSIIATTLVFSSMAVHALSFNYLEAEKGNFSYDDDNGTSYKEDYSRIAAVFETPLVFTSPYNNIHPLISVESVKYDEAEILRFGVGLSARQSSDSDDHLNIYMLLRYNDYKNYIKDDKTRFFFSYGLRVLIKKFEGDVSINIDENYDNQNIRTSLGYYITEKFSIAVNFETPQHSKIYSISLRASL